MPSYLRRFLHSGLGPVTVAAALMLSAAACDVDELLEVEDEDVVLEPVFLDPDNLPSVHAGVLREFARAYAGTYNGEGGIILQGGMLADELFNADNFADRQAIDARTVTPVNDANETAFFWLQRARNHAEVAEGLLTEGITEDEDWVIERAEVLALAGFSYVLLGENYCGGVPFSTMTQEGEQIFGAAETTQQIFQRAIDRFDAAIALDPGNRLRRLALVGKARALLNLATNAADVAAAAALVPAAAVPTDYVYEVGYSEGITASSNAVWQLTNAEKRWSVSESEGTNGLPYVTDDDPRVETSLSPGGGFTTDLHYNEHKYPDQGSAIPLATGIEARLIEAEAALRNGPRADFFTIHNALRALVPGLGTITDIGQTQDELIDLHFKERAYWMWLTAHRLGDLRRLVRQYGRAANDVYPIGETIRGVDRGTAVVLPVPFGENNNPLYDASACNTEVP